MTRLGHRRKHPDLREMLQLFERTGDLVVAAIDPPKSASAPGMPRMQLHASITPVRKSDNIIIDIIVDNLGSAGH